MGIVSGMHGNFPAGGGGGGSGGNMYGGGHMFGGFGTVQHPIHGKNGMTFIDRTHPELESKLTCLSLQPTETC